ncbi:MAG: hypothetical protein ACD_39C01767G0007, partial [uncultured bacterium]
MLIDGQISIFVIYCHRFVFGFGGKESRPHPEPLAEKKDRRPVRALA